MSILSNILNHRTNKISDPNWAYKLALDMHLNREQAAECKFMVKSMGYTPEEAVAEVVFYSKHQVTPQKNDAQWASVGVRRNGRT